MAVKAKAKRKQSRIDGQDFVRSRRSLDVDPEAEAQDLERINRKLQRKYGRGKSK